MNGINYSETLWNTYKKINFKFDDKNATLVCPNNPIKGNKWLFKTEYFGAFPDFEIEMLERGYYVANIENATRWCLKQDTTRQFKFAEFLQQNFGLNEKCMTVGMSCGGMQSVYLAAKYPQLVAAMYLDAPVLNLLSCPCGIGDATTDLYEEYVTATGKTISDLINHREHPIDYVDILIKNDIPIFLICGDSDSVVPYHENGKLLFEKYKENQKNIFQVIKKGCEHHPHGLEDNAELIKFALKYY